MISNKTTTAVFCAILAIGATSGPAFADHNGKNHGGGGGGNPGGGGGDSGTSGAFDVAAPGAAPITDTLYNWMHSDVQGAWDDGYGGQGATITFVDDFSGGTFQGTLTGQDCSVDVCDSLTHGQWTSMQGELMAPLATIVQDPWDGNRVSLAAGFNALNLSYGMYLAPGYSKIIWGGQERSIISIAKNGEAVVAKAAGNGCGAETGQTADQCGAQYATNGQLDYLARDLIGTQGTIFVGALDDHGSNTLAWYSNVAGADTTVQQQYLVTGVDAGDMGFAGTSFAAPQVAAMAAITHSKFPTATPAQVADRLLTTTIDLGAPGPDAIFGMGEASLANALAPDSVSP